MGPRPGIEEPFHPRCSWRDQDVSMGGRKTTAGSKPKNGLPTRPPGAQPGAKKFDAGRRPKSVCGCSIPIAVRGHGLARICTCDASNNEPFQGDALTSNWLWAALQAEKELVRTLARKERAKAGFPVRLPSVSASVRWWQELPFRSPSCVCSSGAHAQLLFCHCVTCRHISDRLLLMIPDRWCQEAG